MSSFSQALTLIRSLRLTEADRRFLRLLGGCILLSALTYRIPWLAMWVGFSFAAYSVVANDSIQTIGTFLASNRHRPWWLLWIFVAGIFLVTTYFGWVENHGDVTFGRLTSKGFDQAPQTFNLLQLCAPLVLLILTRMKMPVSTTFLILSCFATTGGSVGKVIFKSVSGYVVAFVCSVLLFLALHKAFQTLRQGRPHPMWHLAQWVTSGFLWAVWIMQDAANVAVFLPRALTPGQLLLYCGAIVAGLAILLRNQGGEIQEVVTEKHDVVDVRPATVIVLVYAAVLYYFKVLNCVPMSTTWVFIGLLAGRELGISIASRARSRGLREVLQMVGRDLTRVALGLVISLLLAALVNPVIWEGFMNL